MGGFDTIIFTFLVLVILWAFGAAVWMAIDKVVEIIRGKSNKE